MKNDEAKLSFYIFLFICFIFTLTLWLGFLWGKTEAQELPTSTEDLATSTENLATTTISNTPIQDKINSKLNISRYEIAEIKADAIYNLNLKGETLFKNGIKVEIINVSKIENGIEYLIRAWNTLGTEQIGFNRGEIDIERIRIHNPPILIPNNTYSKIQTKYDTEKSDKNNYDENPLEAIKETLTTVINIIGIKNSQIIDKDSVGHTTDVFYSYFDAACYKEDSTDWTTTRDATAAGACNTNQTVDSHPNTGKTGSNYSISRMFLSFDTSSLTDTAIITSSTLSLYYQGAGANGDDDGKDYIIFVQGTQAGAGSIGVSDFDNIGSTPWTQNIDIGNISALQYYHFNFTDDGKNGISKTDYTKIAGREGHDLDNEAYAGGNNTYNYRNWYLTAQAGTTNDPFLTIVSEASTSTASSSPSSTTSLCTGETCEETLGYLYLMIVSGIVIGSFTVGYKLFK